MAAFALALIGAMSILVIFAVIKLSPRTTSGIRKNSFQVVVLGDIARSPRMQYHALSLAKHGAEVEIIGYLENEPLDELREHGVSFRVLAPPPRVFNTGNKLVFLLTAPFKVLFQALMLWTALTQGDHAYEWMLIQNPPAIPTMLLAVIACQLRGTKLVVDWHNLGYSIMALKLGRSHPLVTIAKLYEERLGNMAQAHLAVTDAMNDLLKKQLHFTSPVMSLHDRPAPLFTPLTDEERSSFLLRSPLTQAEAPAILNKQARLLVSSTSWTADEDFSVLLDALRSYSESATTSAPQLPELHVIITGKGPLQDHYVNKINSLEANQELEMVHIKTGWLSFTDYASLLASADLGICLHTSSSGVDLPMKVVDMFGAGLPVLGYSNFKAWSELVQEGVNGQGFSNAAEMSTKLQHLMDPASHTLDILRTGALKESRRRWESEWDPVAGKLFGLVT